MQGGWRVEQRLRFWAGELEAIWAQEEGGIGHGIAGRILTSTPSPISLTGAEQICNCEMVDRGPSSLIGVAGAR